MPADGSDPHRQPTLVPAPPGDIPKPSTPAPDPPPPAAAAAGNSTASVFAVGDDGSSTVRSVIRRWRREDLLKKSELLLRGLGAIFALFAVLVMGSNKHGDWRNFDQYQEYRYLLAIVILAFLYSLAQAARQVHRLESGNDLLPGQYAGIVDFAGDQVLAYLLISAFSAAIPITDRMRESADNIFTDASAASITMTFFAFVAMASSTLLSGYKLSKQSYI